MQTLEHRKNRHFCAFFCAFTPQLGEQIQNDLFSVPWGHHCFIIDKFKEQPEKALFFVHQTVENGTQKEPSLLCFISSLCSRALSSAMLMTIGGAG